MFSRSGKATHDNTFATAESTRQVAVNVAGVSQSFAETAIGPAGRGSQIPQQPPLTTYTTAPPHRGALSLCGIGKQGAQQVVHFSR
jgi:hypothetical protein